jgi:hypothetical protein
MGSAAVARHIAAVARREHNGRQGCPPMSRAASSCGSVRSWRASPRTLDACPKRTLGQVCPGVKNAAKKPKEVPTCPALSRTSNRRPVMNSPLVTNRPPATSPLSQRPGHRFLGMNRLPAGHEPPGNDAQGADSRSSFLVLPFLISHFAFLIFSPHPAARPRGAVCPSRGRPQ